MTEHDDRDGDGDFDLVVHDADRPDDAVDTECLGYYDSVTDYLRVAVDTLVIPEGEWLLECLDYARVQEALEAGGLFRLRVAGGRVFRDRLGGRGRR